MPQDNAGGPQLETEPAALELLARLLGNLVTARTVDAILRDFREFVSNLLPDSYASLWYLDERASPPCLLLADEFGNRYGGSVKPLHNRVALNAGIVGRAAASNVIERRDMTLPFDRAIAADLDTVDREHLHYITAVPWVSSPAVPGGVVLIGTRTPRQLLSNDESTVGRAAAHVVSSLTQVVESRSRSVLPTLVSALSELRTDTAILETATNVLAREFTADYALAMLTHHEQPKEALLVERYSADEHSRLPGASRISGFHFANLPPSVRLFHATDPEELRQAGLPEHFSHQMHSLLSGKVDRLSHIIAASLRDSRSDRTDMLGLVMLARSPDALGFLPEEERVLTQIAEHISLLIVLNRREATRSRVVSATLNVAELSDLELALVSFFISAEDLTGYDVASVLLETETSHWNSYTRAADVRMTERTHGLDPRSVPVSDSAVRAMDKARVELATATQPSDSPMARMGERLVPPPDHRSLARNKFTQCFPLIFRRELRGAIFLSFSDTVSVITDRRPYIELLGQQLVLTANLDRLRRTEDRFLTLVHSFDRLLSGSILSLALGHETKGKLNTFARGFGNLGKIADRIDSTRVSSELREEVGALKRLAKVGTETVATLDELTSAMSAALLRDRGTHQDALFSKEDVYLNDVVRLYYRGLRLAGYGEDRDESKEIVLSLAPDLDAPKQGLGNPLSSDAFDRVRIGQVLSNLVLNALDASPRRSRVEIATSLQKSHDERSRTAILIVRDYGVGMTDEVKARIFEPFFSRKPFGAQPGFGLGMLIVSLLVQEMEGVLSFDSKPNAGTTFRIELPVPLRPKSSGKR